MPRGGIPNLTHTTTQFGCLPHFFLSTGHAADFHALESGGIHYRVCRGTMFEGWNCAIADTHRLHVAVLGRHQLVPGNIISFCEILAGTSLTASCTFRTSYAS